MFKVNLLLLSFFLISCSGQEPYQPQYNKALWNKIKENKYSFINFSDLAGPTWTKVCFLGPYNQSADSTLGFQWKNPPIENLALLREDSHNMIIFATDFEVIDAFVQNRSYGDFWQLSGKCLSRDNSRVIQNTESGGGYVTPSMS